MKTKFFLGPVIAGIVLAGCSSTQNTATDLDSDSVAIMQDTIPPDTLGVDTATLDTAGIDTSRVDSL